MTDQKPPPECRWCGCPDLRLVRAEPVLGRIRTRYECEHCGRPTYVVTKPKPPG